MTDVERLSSVVFGAIETALTPLVTRLAALEAKAGMGPMGPMGPPGEPGEPGEPGLMGEMGPMGPCGPCGPQGEPGPMGPMGPQGEAGIAGPMGPAGPQGEMGPIGPMGEKGEPGDVGPMGPAGTNGADGLMGAPGRPGRDAEPPTREFIIEALKALPDAFDEAVRRYFKLYPVPIAKDGVGVAGAVIDRDGCLTLTLSDGTLQSLGRVVGEKGEDGRPGAHGLDGIGFDDLVVEHDGERAFTFKAVQGDRVRSWGPFIVPAQIHRGVWREGTRYERGDVVTWAGSMWTAKDATTAKPGETAEASRAWQLSVKAGRDGKPGAEGKQGLIGVPGPPGPMGPRWQ